MTGISVLDLSGGGGPRLLLVVEPTADVAVVRGWLRDARVVGVVAGPLSAAEIEALSRTFAEPGSGAAPTAGAAAAAAPPAGFSVALAALWRRTLPTFGARVEVIDEAVCALLCGVLSPEIRTAAEREAHKLAGALGTFGLPEGSRVAREIEAMLGAPEPLERRCVTDLFHLTRALRMMLAVADAP